MEDAIKKSYRKLANRFPIVRAAVDDMRRYGRVSLALKRSRPDTRFVPILGMHRSGTSCVAEVLAANGLHIGHDLVKPNDHNPHGFFEAREAVAINDAVLAVYGGEYLKPPPIINRFPRFLLRRARRFLLTLSDSSHLVGWKDPRTILAWRAWHELLSKSDYRVVGCFRHPLRTASSLLRIYRDMDRATAVSLWLNYNRRLLGLNEPVILVNFDAPLAQQMPRVCRRLSMTFRADSLGRFEDALVHHRMEPEATGNVEADCAYDWLLRAWSAQQAAVEISAAGETPCDAQELSLRTESV